MKNSPLISLQSADVFYKHLHVLKSCNVTIDEGELVVLMGPNGAGKSTVLRALFGAVPLAAGTVAVDGITVQANPHTMRGLGISFVTQGKRVFPNLTVEENIRIGAHDESDSAVIEHNLERSFELFPMFKNLRFMRAGGLSGGQQQMVAIARGMMSSPRVLLLDEPTLGLSPKMVTEVFDVVESIRTQQNIAVVVVEHNIKSLLTRADRVYVLSRGETAFMGTAEELRQSNILEEVFLK